jgi:hypothetical protein
MGRPASSSYYSTTGNGPHGAATEAAFSAPVTILSRNTLNYLQTADIFARKTLGHARVPPEKSFVDFNGETCVCVSDNLAKTPRPLCQKVGFCVQKI